MKGWNDGCLQLLGESLMNNKIIYSFNVPPTSYILTTKEKHQFYSGET